MSRRIDVGERSWTNSMKSGNDFNSDESAAKSETPSAYPCTRISFWAVAREKGPSVYILHERPRLYGMAGIRIRILIHATLQACLVSWTRSVSPS